MNLNRLLRTLMLCPLLLLIAIVSQAQTKTINGKILDEKGNPVAGASVVAKGSKGGTTTDASGTFKITVPQGASSVTISYVGYASQTVDITSTSDVSISLIPSGTNLTDVVVIGYGSTQRKDITGSIASVKAKDFNKDVISPEELLIGKVAGLQVSDNSGQPGATTITKIRGNNSIVSGNNPLYVIDGVPIDATSPIVPNLISATGTITSNNPLLFLNPGDISQIDVLKDASSAAIYGARGENGVVLITTNRGSGKLQVDAGVTLSTYAGLMKKADVLSASQYRSELAKYGQSSDSGASINPFNSILQNKLSNLYTVALSGGGTNGRFRASFSANNREGIILKSDLKQYNATFSGDNSFLNSRLKINYNVIASNYTLQTAPIGATAGSTGNLISAALNWNPTLSLYHDGTFYQSSTTNLINQINPLALSAYTDDYAHVTQIFANTGVSFTIVPHLTYNFLYGINYASSVRDAQLQGLIEATGGNGDGKGLGEVGNASITTQTLTHTLTFDKDISSSLNLRVLAGYEYYKTSSLTGEVTTANEFGYNIPGGAQYPNIPYYRDMQASNQALLATVSYDPPNTELQSYFARAEINFQQKYYLSGTFRADGSSKFGSNNRYGYFPSFGFRWNAMNENFMKGAKLFNNLALRLGYGQVGGQDGLQPGSAQQIASLSGYTGATSTTIASSSLNVGNYASPNLKWETLSSYDGGIDYGILNNRIFGYIDIFSKKTTNPIFPATLPVPSSGATIYENLPGYITNKGFEVSVGAAIIHTKNFTWNINTNMEYVRNKFVYPALGTSPLYLTGAVNGQGVSSAFSEAIANNQPIDVFYLRQFTGFDKNGVAQVASQASTYVGDPNPHVLLGLNTDLSYKKLSLTINTHGAFGNKIFNNTLVSVTNLGNIANGKNLAASLIGTQESLVNPVSASTRFLESGNFLKVGNVTLAYTIGDIGRNVLKNARIFVTGYNLIEITKYKGFDAEVNQDHNNNGVPSLGLDYIGYPTSRIVTFGFNFSLY